MPGIAILSGLTKDTRHWNIKLDGLNFYCTETEELKLFAIPWSDLHITILYSS